MILIFQMKSHPKCQLDMDSFCSQTFSHILGLIRGQQRVLLAFAPLHTRSGAFGTDTSHMSVRFYCECKCLGSTLWPGRLNVVYVFFFIVTSVFFVVVFRLLVMKFIVSAFNDLICSASLLLVSEIWLYLSHFKQKTETSNVSLMPSTVYHVSLKHSTFPHSWTSHCHFSWLAHLQTLAEGLPVHLISIQAPAYKSYQSS